jgi:hypothetical protein
MKPVDCQFCGFRATRYTAIRPAPCDDCGGAKAWACRGCVSDGRRTHTRGADGWADLSREYPEVETAKRTCGTHRGPAWSPIPPLTRIPKGAGHSLAGNRIRLTNTRWARKTEEEREAERARARAEDVELHGRAFLRWEAKSAPDAQDPGVVTPEDFAAAREAIEAQEAEETRWGDVDDAPPEEALAEAAPDVPTPAPEPENAPAVPSRRPTRVRQTRRRAEKVPDPAPATPEARPTAGEFLAAALDPERAAERVETLSLRAVRAGIGAPGCVVCGGSGFIDSRRHSYTCPACGPSPPILVDGARAAPAPVIPERSEAWYADLQRQAALWTGRDGA